MTRIFSAKVQNGVIQAQELDLPEGAEVTICLADDELVALSPEQEARLLASIQQADRGLGIPAEQVLAAFSRR